MFQWLSELVGRFADITPLTWALVACVAGMGVLIIVLWRQRWSAAMIARGALSLALSFILSCLVVFHMPQGGSITPASMLPIFAFAWIYGPGPGIAVGTAYGLLQLVQDPQILHPAQVFLDYIFPFAALGAVGFFRKNFFAGMAAAAVLRFLSHFVSGFVFWSAYAGDQNPVIYSLIYNGTYLAPELAVCMAVMLIPAARALLKRLKAQWAAPAAKS